MYHFDGRNYEIGSTESRDFSSRKLVGHGEKGFFYITKCAEAINSPEGYGKAFSISNREEGFYKGKGYFFDVTDKESPQIMYTYMFKFEPNFYNNHIKIHPNDNPEKFSDEKIINAVRDYVKDIYNVDV